MKRIEPGQAEEFRTYGPPGTGKTTWVAEQATAIADRSGGDMVSIVSLTNSAIREVAGRDLPIQEGNISTLHAQCKRALEAPGPAEDYVEDFAKVYPEHAQLESIPKQYLFGNTQDDSDGPLAEKASAGGGLTYMEKANVLRQRLVPMNEWPTAVREWFTAWDSWMYEYGHLDFVGWLEEALDRSVLPVQNTVFVDEAQDHTPLQLAIIRNWPAEKIVLIGDDDQNLYEWSGSLPQEFFEPNLAEENELVLGQSWRVPRAVHKRAMGVANQIRYRKKKLYHPRDEEGEVQFSNYSWDEAKKWGGVPPGLAEAAREGTVMILTTCIYMLDPILDALRQQGIPFHNPYRRGTYKWNPTHHVSKRIDAFLARGGNGHAWTGEQVIQWVDVLSAKPFAFHGAKTQLLSLAKANWTSLLPDEWVLPYIREDLREQVLMGDIAFLSNFHNKKHSNSSWELGLAHYEYGEEKPNIIVGTIHSVKGGEADTVYLFPDLSQAGYDGYSNPKTRDRALRQMYVGMTRARERLVICSPEGNRFIRI